MLIGCKRFNSLSLTLFGQYQTAVADLHSKILDARPSRGPNSFNFMQFFGRFWQNRVLAPPSPGWVPLPQGNPESATELFTLKS